MTRDWDELERWDRAYYLHGLQAEAEHSFTGVDATDGNYLVLADGTRLLDFMSQLISDNLGHRHPAIHGALAEAMERYGHVTYTMANEYRAPGREARDRGCPGQRGVGRAAPHPAVGHRGGGELHHDGAGSTPGAASS